MQRPGCLTGLVLLLYPILMLQFQQAALLRIGLAPQWVPLLVALTLLGGMIHLPLWSREVESLVPCPPPRWFGLPWGAPVLMRRRQHQVIALNLGGGLIPGVLSLIALASLPAPLLPRVGLVFLGVCLVAYRSSKVIAQVGILMQPILPALASALLASWLVPSAAPAVAFACGVLGVLVGADLLRLGPILRSGVAVVSIGGAGTFDGIWLTGLMAGLLS